MADDHRGRTRRLTILSAILFLCLVLGIFISLQTPGISSPVQSDEKPARISDHFDGETFFNPGTKDESTSRTLNWVWRFVTGKDWSTWPAVLNGAPGKPPVERTPAGKFVVTPIGHGTFLIQLDELNILTDPIWSDRCSPVSWAGPKRYQAPGIRFEDLPPIDAVLVSHNHYDHLDMPTLERLAVKGVRRSITTLGNRERIRESGIAEVEELDWWQSARLSKDVTVTVVPAQHFSARTPWDRNKTLWGGFVISGPSGVIYYSGDTGYGAHFREIAKRFSPIDAALLPISPFWPPNSNPSVQRRFTQVHMGPEEAVQAHIDLAARLSIAAHFQVFQLGGDGFDDAPAVLKAALAKHHLWPETFIVPSPGQKIELTMQVAALRKTAF